MKVTAGRRTPRWRRWSTIVGAAVVATLVAGGVITAASSYRWPADASSGAARATPPPAARPTPSASTHTPPAIPAKPSPQALAALPLAFYDATIPTLLDSTAITPTNRWEIATPKDELVALYASASADSAPIAALGSMVKTVNTPTAVAVYGISGDMILVSTPSRRSVPGIDSPTAASATFAWARRDDFVLANIAQTVFVDTATSIITIADAAGTASASETARLGTPGDPTPAATSSYIESIYIDRLAAYTHGNPVSLTGAHSSTLAGYGGNSALTALHYYPDPTGSSHGCVRVSAAMTEALAALPIGTPVIFS